MKVQGSQGMWLKYLCGARILALRGRCRLLGAIRLRLRRVPLLLGVLLRIARARGVLTRATTTTVLLLPKTRRGLLMQILLLVLGMCIVLKTSQRSSKACM